MLFLWQLDDQKIIKNITTTVLHFEQVLSNHKKINKLCSEAYEFYCIFCNKRKIQVNLCDDKFFCTLTTGHCVSSDTKFNEKNKSNLYV